MLGFLVGTACLIGLVKVARGGGGCGRGFGHHHRGWHHHGHHGWGGGWQRGGWGGGWMRGLFERLDTSPGQEKVIKQAVEEIFGATRSLRTELDDTRRDIAAALRAGIVDEVQMGELFARHDEKLREVRKAMVGAFARVSDALDETQRKQLADLIERGLAGGGGGWGRFGGGPYRGRSDWA
ncbi:Hypothetical protein I5071_68790 [Sandaracinus amylolyticus]|nr:Hypothetical protein I5071_68790 [Sandaracinus amylolyticus]